MSFRFANFHVPRYAKRNSTERLECSYELEKGEQLYALKWSVVRQWKFQRTEISLLLEFMSTYVQAFCNPNKYFIRKFIVNCPVVLQLKLSTTNVIVLDRLDLRSSGNYSCEVTIEHTTSKLQK